MGGRIVFTPDYTIRFAVTAAHQVCAPDTIFFNHPYTSTISFGFSQPGSHLNHKCWNLFPYSHNQITYKKKQKLSTVSTFFERCPLLNDENRFTNHYCVIEVYSPSMHTPSDQNDESSTLISGLSTLFRAISDETIGNGWFVTCNSHNERLNVCQTSNYKFVWDRLQTTCVECSQEGDELTFALLVTYLWIRLGMLSRWIKLVSTHRCPS